MNIRQRPGCRTTTPTGDFVAESTEPTTRTNAAEAGIEAPRKRRSTRKNTRKASPAAPAPTTTIFFLLLFNELPFMAV